MGIDGDVLGQLGGRPLSDGLGHLLEGALLRFELDLELGDVLLLVDSPLKQLHGREEVLDLRAQILLLNNQVFNFLRVHSTREVVDRRALPLVCRHVRTRPGRLHLLLGHGLLLHLEAVVVNSQVFDLQLQDLHLVLQLPVFNLVLDGLLVGFAELTENLILALLQILVSQGVTWPTNLEILRRSLVMLRQVAETSLG